MSERRARSEAALIMLLAATCSTAGMQEPSVPHALSAHTREDGARVSPDAKGACQPPPVAAPSPAEALAAMMQEVEAHVVASQGAQQLGKVSGLCACPGYCASLARTKCFASCTRSRAQYKAIHAPNTKQHMYDMYAGFRMRALCLSVQAHARALTRAYAYAMTNPPRFFHARVASVVSCVHLNPRP